MRGYDGQVGGQQYARWPDEKTEIGQTRGPVPANIVNSLPRLDGTRPRRKRPKWTTASEVVVAERRGRMFASVFVVRIRAFYSYDRNTNSIANVARSKHTRVLLCSVSVENHARYLQKNKNYSFVEFGHEPHPPPSRIFILSTCIYIYIYTLSSLADRFLS